MTDTAITHIQIQTPTRATPTLPEILRQLGPMPGKPALLGVCKDGLPLIVDLADRKISSLLTANLSDQDAARLLWVMFQSAKHWSGDANEFAVSFHLVRNVRDFPEHPSGIIVIPDQIGFFNPGLIEPQSIGLKRCIEERTAFVIMRACWPYSLPVRFDIEIGIDPWGRWSAYDWRRRETWEFELPEVTE